MSAEVYYWGPMAPGSEDGPTPFEAARQDLPKRVQAGFGGSVVHGATRLTWAYNTCGDHQDISNVQAISFGEGHTLLFRKHGGGGADSVSITEVFSWGKGQYGQLGLGARYSESTYPQQILALQGYRVVQVACGGAHSAVLTSCGDVFTWGRGMEGQLGHASRHLPDELNESICGTQLLPKAVPTFLATKKRSRPVSSISCGQNFTLVITRAGEIWAFGEGGTGQLGVGRVTKIAIPTMVLKECPLTGKPFVEVAAGWSHSLARSSQGFLFSWGFNALGALGLGDNKTRFKPEVILGTSATGKEDMPLEVTKIGASGNCSGALTAKGELLTWGCSSKGKLGYRESSSSVTRPKRVEGLNGKVVTDFALCNGGGMALVPLHVYSIDPKSGPLSGGCTVTIRGCGFWNSDDIVVRFAPVEKGSNAVSRSSIGKYAGVGKCHHEMITCVVPCFAEAELVYVEVSIRGNQFTEDGKTFCYYIQPVLTDVTPIICKPPFDGKRIRLDGEFFTPGETSIVRFEEENGSPSCEGVPLRTFFMPAELESELITPMSREDPSEPWQPPPDKEKQRCLFITCDTPPVEGQQMPFISRVSLALNGQSFTICALEHPLRFVAHDPQIYSCSPVVVPAIAGVLLQLFGKSLYAAPEAAARIRYGSEDEDVIPLQDMAVKATGDISVALPETVSELVCEPSAPARFVVLEVTMDGEDYVAMKDYLTIYRECDFTIVGSEDKEDTCFLLAEKGGVVQLQPCTSIFRSQVAQVRLHSFRHSIDVTVPLYSELSGLEARSVDTEGKVDVHQDKSGKGENGMQEGLITSGRKILSARKSTTDAANQIINEESDNNKETPSSPTLEEQETECSSEPFNMVVPPLSQSSHQAQIMGSDGCTEDIADMTTKKHCVELTKDSSIDGLAGDGDLDSETEIATGVSGYSMDEAEAEKPELIPSNRTMSVEVSFNGFHWWSTKLQVTYFLPPVIQSVKPESVAISGIPSTNFTLTGNGFFDSGRVKVRLLISREESVSKRGSIQKAEAGSGGLGNGVGASLDTKGTVKRGRIDKDEPCMVVFQLPESLPAALGGALPATVGVQVSLNNGLNFSPSNVVVTVKKR